jgi:hypothetical protein
MILRYQVPYRLPEFDLGRVVEETLERLGFR